MEPSVKPPVGSRRRWLVRAGVIVLLLIGITWPYTRLLVVLSREAADRYPGGVIKALAPFRPDSTDLLERYSPNRLAGVLWYPSASVRALICELLSTRHPKWDSDADWVGIIPKLCRIATTDSDKSVRALALAAVQESPKLTDADVDAILAEVKNLPTGPDRQKLLGVVIQKNPNGADRISATLETLSKSTNRADQLDALAVVAHDRPAFEGAGALVRRIASSDSGDS